MPDKPMIAVIGATEHEFLDCRERLQSFDTVPCISQPHDLDQLEPTVAALLIYAGKTQQETLALCETIRCHHRTARTPILLVAQNHNIQNAFVVKRTGRAALITTPLDTDELEDSLSLLLTGESASA